MCHQTNQRGLRVLVPASGRDQRGEATVTIVFLAVALLAALGLAIDGGYALASKRQAMTHAEQAARVASDQLSQAALRNGNTAVNVAQAHGAARGYLSRVGAHGSVSINGGGRVTVTVTDTYRTAIMSIVGLNQINVRARATAVSLNEDDNP